MTTRGTLRARGGIALSPAQAASRERRIARDYRDGVDLKVIKQRHGAGAAEAHAIAERMGIARRIGQVPSISISAMRHRAKRRAVRQQAAAGG